MSEYLPPTHPDQPEEFIPPYDISTVPDEAADNVPTVELLPKPTTLASGTAPEALLLPPVILGCAPFGYGIYADKDDVRSNLPLRLVRLALRAGMNAFDTSPHYHPSEIILGNALRALAPEFPRESYTLITKAGKYGPKVGDHKYEPEVVRRSVERSLRRLGTDYLDVVYLHDAEFVASAPFPCPSGGHLEALGAKAAEFHLEPPYNPLGPGDESILACLAVLRELQAAGKIRRIGLAGYPLPVLLRLSLLALHNAPFIPVDIVQTYSHQTILTSTLGEGYLDALTERARVPQVVNAAPLAMGILTSGGGPEWHPAKKEEQMYAATRQAVELCHSRGTSIEAVSCTFGYRTLKQHDGVIVPVVIGCTTLEQIHLTLQTYHDVNQGGAQEGPSDVEKEVIRLFEEKGVRNTSWQSPSPAAFE